MVSQYCTKLEYKSNRAFANNSAGWLRTSIDGYNEEILLMVIMNLLWTYNVLSVEYVCPRKVLAQQLSVRATRTFKWKKELLKGKKICFYHTVLKSITTTERLYLKKYKNFLF